MSAAGTIGVSDYYAGGEPIRVRDLQERLGLSRARTNDVVLELEKVTCTPIQQMGSGRLYTTHIAEVLAEAQASKDSLPEGLRAALRRRGVEVPEPERVYTTADLVGGMFELHGMLVALKERADQEEPEVKAGLTALQDRVTALEEEVVSCHSAVDHLRRMVEEMQGRLDQVEAQATGRWWQGVADAGRTALELLLGLPRLMRRLIRR